MLAQIEKAEHAILEPLSNAPPAWREGAQAVLTIWRTPTFDPYASWTIYQAGETWARRVVAHIHHPALAFGPKIYVADCLFSADAARTLHESLDALIQTAATPRESGITLDGMHLGIRCAHADLKWYSHLATPLNRWWAAARETLDAGMPASTVPIQSAHQWIDAGDE